MFLKIFSGMANSVDPGMAYSVDPGMVNSVDPDPTAASGAV